MEISKIYGKGFGYDGDCRHSRGFGIDVDCELDWGCAVLARLKEQQVLPM